MHKYVRTANGRIGRVETTCGITNLITCDGFLLPIERLGKKHEIIGELRGLPDVPYLNDEGVNAVINNASDEIGEILVHYTHDGWKALSVADARKQLSYRVGSTGYMRNPISQLKHIGVLK